jgi:SWI/SNF-related matrix-associated actin-dependent regulator of chromatin subfamily A protein 2/4
MGGVPGTSTSSATSLPPMGGAVTGATPTSVSSSVDTSSQKAVVRQVKLTPLAKPPGLDPVLLMREREARIQSRIAHRIHELENLPNVLSDEVRLKALIELKALKLLDFQTQVCTRSVLLLRMYVVCFMCTSTVLFYVACTDLFVVCFYIVV